MKSLDPSWRTSLENKWAEFLQESDSDFATHWIDAIEKIRREAAGPAGPAYLLTWNPELFPFSDIEDRISEVEHEGFTQFGWSLGVRRHVSVGDRVFLMRQGDHPGLVGSGRITGDPTTLPHFNPEKAAAGKTYVRVPVRWEALSREPNVGIETLDKQFHKQRLWRTQAGGVRIDPDLVVWLDEIWRGAGEGSRDAPSATIVASLDPDRVSPNAVDHLGVESEAFAFARVAASKSIVPPLSIGVFGEWGSGKTFFMEKIRSHVSQLQASAQAAKRDGQETAYHTDIVQIPFNAWHYMETNLWASLVEHIFRELDKWLRRERKDPKQVEALYKRLSTSRLLKLEALEEFIAARRRRKEAEDQVKAARHELARTESREAAVTLAEFWQAVRDTVPSTVTEDDKKSLVEAAERLSFVDVANSANEMMVALSEAQDQTRRGKLIVRSVVSRLGHPVWIVPLLVLLLVLPVLVPPLVDWLLRHAENPILSQEISKTALAISTMLTTATAWVGAAVALGKRALTRLKVFQESLDNALKNREDSEPHPILQAEQVLAQRQKDVALAESALDTAAQDLEEASAEFDETAAVRLNRFIRDKIVNGDYAKHLGIIASIRKDFEHLAEIMLDLQAEQGAMTEYQGETQAYQAKIASLDLGQLETDGLLTEQERTEIETEQTLPDQDLRFFRRIILYIDDLDRCPPKTVVQVLQACHLLLSFPLFIVVVAVDARWLSGALLEHYQGLLSSDSADGENPDWMAPEAAGAASPRDYLEKIFQIPYWVPRISPEASESYTRDLVGRVEGEDETPTPPEIPVQSDRESSVPDDEADPELPTSEPSEKSEDDSRRTTTTDNTVVSEHAKETAIDPSTGPLPQADPQDIPHATETKHQELGDGVDPNPKSLLMTKHERDLLARLAPFAGDSPRTIKRFVNVYRLLRTALDDDDLHVLVGKKGESRIYRAIIAQLAIVTGAPTLADAYFDALGSKNKADKTTPTTLINALEKMARTAAPREWKAIEGSLGVLKELDNSKEMLAEMRDRANVVKRYSFSARSYL